MRVALDISKMHNLSLDRGIGVYAKNLFLALKKYTDIEVELITDRTNLSQYDLIHQPFFDFYKRTLDSDLPIPVIVTIHDLIPLLFKEHYPAGIKGVINWQFQKSGIKKIKSIIAVSKTVKSDIVNELKINPEKISVIYSAPSEIFHKFDDSKKIIQRFSLPKEFVLYVGNINWNKNILNITEGVVETGKNLVIIGNAFKDLSNLDHPEKKSFKIWLKRYGNNPGIHLLGGVSDGELVAVMNNAKALVFASYYEGFGLPILEAQACGLPVITSNVSATAEIAGNSAILVTPESPKEIKEAISKIFTDDLFRKSLIQKGLENNSRFSWKQTALLTVEAYKNALI